MRFPITLTLGLLLVLASGCSTRGTLLPEYRDLEVDGGTLVVAPFNRAHAVDVDLSTARDEPSDQNPEIRLVGKLNASIVAKSRRMTRFDVVAQADYGARFDFEPRLFQYSPTYGKNYEFEIRLPAEGTRVQFEGHEADYVLFLGDIEAREQGGSTAMMTPTGEESLHRSPTGFISEYFVDYVLWDNTEGRPASYGIIMATGGKFSDESVLSLGQKVANGIFEGTPFEAVADKQAD